MKTLKFTPALRALIAAGEKSATWRLFDDKDLQVGDEICFVDKQTGETFGTGVITTLKITTLGNLNDDDWDGHERYASEDEMYAAYRGYYPDQSVGPETELKIISFSFVPSS